MLTSSEDQGEAAVTLTEEGVGESMLSSLQKGKKEV